MLKRVFYLHFHNLTRGSPMTFGTCAVFGGLGAMGKGAVIFMKDMFEKFVIIDERVPTDGDRIFFEKTVPGRFEIMTESFTDGTDFIAQALKMHSVSVCIGTLPSRWQILGAYAALRQHSCHYFDLGADNDVLMEQREIFSKTNREKIFMPFCGFDPGILNILVLSATKHPICDSIEVLVGGFPAQVPENALCHEWTFNPTSTLETYRGETCVIENGKLTLKSALTGYSNISYEHRIMGAFYTNCGNIQLMEKIATNTSIMRRLKTCAIRSIRHLGHWEAIRSMAEGGLFDDDVFKMNAQKLAKAYPHAKNDIAFMRIICKKNSNFLARIEWSETSDKDFSAMQKATMKSTTLIVQKALECFYADTSPRISGFMMPETFVSETLNLSPNNIIRLMQAFGMNVRMSVT